MEYRIFKNHALPWGLFQLFSYVVNKHIYKVECLLLAAKLFRTIIQKEWERELSVNPYTNPHKNNKNMQHLVQCHVFVILTHFICIYLSIKLIQCVSCIINYSIIVWDRFISRQVTLLCILYSGLGYIIIKTCRPINALYIHNHYLVSSVLCLSVSSCGACIQ